MEKLINLYKNKEVCATVQQFLDCYDSSNEGHQNRFFIDFVTKYKKELKESDNLDKEIYEKCRDFANGDCIRSLDLLDELDKTTLVKHMKKRMLKDLNVKDEEFKQNFECWIHGFLKYDKEKEFLIDIITEDDERWSDELISFLEEKGWLKVYWHSYEIFLDKLNGNNLVGDSGKVFFKNWSDAERDAMNLIYNRLMEEYNSDFNEFRIELHEHLDEQLDEGDDEYEYYQ